jgi:hypothetical protein
VISVYILYTLGNFPTSIGEAAMRTCNPERNPENPERNPENPERNPENPERNPELAL